jgi:hypothetical protein
VIAVIYFVRGGGSDSPNVTAGTTSTPTASSTPSDTPSPSASPSVTDPPTQTATPPATSTASPPIVPGSKGGIYVYTAPGGRSQLAAAVQRLTAAGYTVKRTNAVGLHPSKTTVYYGRGNADEAAAMVAAQVGVLAAAPRPSGYTDPATLFVVVTASYR